MKVVTQVEQPSLPPPEHKSQSSKLRRNAHLQLEGWLFHLVKILRVQNMPFKYSVNTAGTQK